MSDVYPPCAPGATSKASAGVEASRSSTSENAPSSRACRSRKTLERPPRDGSGPRRWSTLAAFRGGASQVPCGGGSDQLRLVPCRPRAPRRRHDGRPHHRFSEALAGHAGGPGPSGDVVPPLRQSGAPCCRRSGGRPQKCCRLIWKPTGGPRALSRSSARRRRRGFGGRASHKTSSTSPLELMPAPDPRGHIYDPPARLQRGLSPPSGRSPTGCPESEIIAHRARRRSSPRVHGRRLCTGDHWAATGPGIGARGAGPADLVSRCCQSFRPQKAARARAQHAELGDTNALGPRSRPATYVISGVQLRAEPQNDVGPEA